ncbi:hypothetical protein BMR09_17745, partial [Methylococcaceae bacterium CS3]
MATLNGSTAIRDKNLASLARYRALRIGKFPCAFWRLSSRPGLTAREAFETECTTLLPLPDNRWPTDERGEVKAGKTPYIRFDKNDYSIPHTQVRKILTVTATLKQVRILDGQTEIAN